ncbi:MAG: lipopolysaccharide biosynthesis protein [Bacteroidota bacterium]
MSQAKSTFTKGVIWNFADTIGSQIVGFVVSLFLARLVSPEHFGTFATVFVFTGFLQLLVGSSLGETIIMTQDTEWITLNSVFIYNNVVALIFYLLLFFTAPLIADFYQIQELNLAIRLMALSLPFWSASNIQLTLMYKDVDFKKMFYIKFPGLLLSSVIGMVMAFNHYGVWALVWQILSLNFFTALMAILRSDFRPGFAFSWEKIRGLFSVSGRFVISGIINRIFESFYPLIIGKLYSLSALGFYNRANSIKDIVVGNLVQVIGKVGFPVFVTMKDNPEKLKDAYKRVMQVTFYVIAPLMFGGMAISYLLITTIFGNHWAPAVPYFRISCLIGLMYPFHIINLDIPKVFAKSAIYLKLEVIKKALILAGILCTYKLGVMGMLYGQLAVSALNMYVNAHYCGRIIHYYFLEQIRDILPEILIAILMAVPVYFLSKQALFESQLLNLFCLILAAFIIYVFLSFVFQLKSFRYIAESIRLKFLKTGKTEQVL